MSWTNPEAPAEAAAVATDDVTDAQLEGMRHPLILQHCVSATVDDVQTNMAAMDEVQTENVAEATTQPAASELFGSAAIAHGLSGIWCVWHGGVSCAAGSIGTVWSAAIADGLSGIWCVWHGSVGCAAGGIELLALSSHRRRTQRHLVFGMEASVAQPAASELFGGEAERQPALQIEEHAELQLRQQQLESQWQRWQRRLRRRLWARRQLLIRRAAPVVGTRRRAIRTGSTL